MKKKYVIWFVWMSLIALVTSCGNKNEFVLKGTLGTEKGEKFLVVFDDPIAKIDSIIPIEGEFEYTFIPDTTTLIRLVNKDGISIPVFAEKGWEVEMKGTFDKPLISGEAHNHDYHDFLKSIEGLEDQDTIAIIAEKFIRKHPHSFASAYLIDRYFIQAPNPDIQKVESLIIPLNGEVKDSRILNVAMKSIPTDKEKNHKNLSYYSLTDRNGKYISWNIKKDQFILVNFWASWDQRSKVACDSLHKQIKELPKDRVKVLNVALDYDKAQWLKACQKDDDFWIETCNFNGWEAPIVKQNNILTLPSNILINNQRNILARNIYGQALTDSLTIKKDNKDTKKSRK